MNGPCMHCGQQCDGQFPRNCKVEGKSCMPARHGWFEGDLATYGKHVELEPGYAEPEPAYRQRVADALRDRGQIIEAHEILAGRRYDADPSGVVIAGVAGHAAAALGMGGPPNPTLGDEVVMGHVALGPADPMASAMEALGPDVIMKLFGGGR